MKKDKEYYQKYLGSGREIILIGAKFSTKKHNIADWKKEIVDGSISSAEAGSIK